jgi:(2Fe-2S) ferredoxin
MSDPRLFYESHVFVCKNERAPNHPRGCCLHRGSGELHAYMKERAKQAGLKNTRINQSGCFERCEMGPTMVIYPEGVWYTYRNKEDIDEIIQKHMIEGGRVERLMLMPDDKFPAHREARLAEMEKADRA